MFSSSCLTVLAPIITDGMKSFCRHQRSDTWPCVLPIEKSSSAKEQRYDVDSRQVGNHGQAFMLFADDTNIFTSHHSYEALFQLMNEELSHVNDWFALNK